jgi:hypothetical protein
MHCGLLGLCGLCCLYCFVGSACAFPIIDFEEHSAPRRLAYHHVDVSPPPSAAVQPQPVRLTRLTRAQPARPAPRPLARASRSSASRDDAYDMPPEPESQPRASVVAPAIPRPERSAPLGERACHERLSAAGVRFAALGEQDAPGVAWPIRLLGPVHGVLFAVADEDSSVHDILDCRLALALVRWAGDLRQAGVRRVDHFSMYRPGARIHGDGAISGHAHGLAIDAARFTTENGAVVDVLDDWEGRKRGQAPCPLRREESGASRLLRRVTCSAVDHKLFSVVLTPHYNKDHDNHVHLEVKPDVDWMFVR